MKLSVQPTAEAVGKEAAKLTADLLNQAIEKNNYARIVLSTGASQFEYFESLVKQKVEWKKVEMFHLDEYIGISNEHKASFQKYLKERFADRLPLLNANYVCGEGNVERNIKELTRLIIQKKVDVAVVGIGENGHIAFNDPPADFEDESAYKIVELNDTCKKQQVGEGWFDCLEMVPNRAITMTVSQIMRAESIISVVPGARKAKAVSDTLLSEKEDPMVPATILKRHPKWYLFIDDECAAFLQKEKLSKCDGDKT